MNNFFTDETDLGATPRDIGPGVHNGEAERDEQRYHLPYSGQRSLEAAREGTG